MALSDSFQTISVSVRHPSPEKLRGDGAMRSETRKRNGRVNERGQYSRPSTDEMTVFLRDQAVRYSVQELEEITGLGTQGVKKIRAGEAAASGAAISAWCRNCPEFRLAYFQFVGGMIETDPGFAVAMSHAIQAYMRGRE